MRSRRSTFQEMNLILYIVIVWLPFFSVWKASKVNLTFLDTRQIGLLLNSIKLGGSTSILVCVLGFLAALFIHNSFLSDKWYRFFFVILMPVPYYVYALSWTYMLRVLVIFWPEILKYSARGFGACVFVETMTYLPIAVLLELAALEMRNRQSEEIALIYKSPIRVLVKNTIPEILPYIVAVAGVIFILSVTDFSVPSMFQYNTYMLDIFSVYSRTGSAAKAYVMAVPLFILLLLPLSFVQQAIRRINKPQRSERFVRRQYPWWLQGSMVCAFGILVCQVLLPLIVFAVTTGGLQNIGKSFEMIYEQIGITLVMSVLAALIAVPCAALATGYLVDKGNGVLWMIALGTMVVPGALQAIGLLSIVNGSVVHGMSMTLFMPALGCALHYMPFVLVVLAGAIKRADQQRRELATLYARQWYRRIMLELGMFLPGILCAFTLVFFLSFGEEGIILVLMPPGAETVSVKIYNYLHYGASEYVSGFCLMVILFMFLVELLLVWTMRRRFRGRHEENGY